MNIYKYLSALFKSKLVFNIDNQQNKVFLTIDDSPSKNTDWILDYLNMNGIKATFFVIGHNVNKNPIMLQKIIEGGHKAGNHGYFHQKGLYSNNQLYYENVAKCDKYANSILYRPPYGSIGIFQILRLIKKYKIVLWNVIFYEWKHDFNLKKAINKVNRIKSGDIILIHDNDKSIENTKILLPLIIEKCKKEGLEFDVIS